MYTVLSTRVKCTLYSTSVKCTVQEYTVQYNFRVHCTVTEKRDSKGKRVRIGDEREIE